MNDASSDYHGTLRTETLVTGSVPDVGFSPAPVVSPAGGDSTAATEDRVKERYCEQREALPGEPRCVICGRYGEYICDETDDDVCSLECKQLLLSKINKSEQSDTVPPPARLPTSDECYYVRDTGTKADCQSLEENQTELLRLKLDISVKGNCVPAPILSFASCNIPRKLLENIEVAGYEMPTPVQMQAIPIALKGQSLLVSAETGSGKTASYMIPVVSYCAQFKHEQSSKMKKPSAMVLAPTRELCIQVEEQAKLLGKGLPFKTALVVGGDPMARQLYRIQEGVSLIVGTPGRLIDLLTKHDMELDSVSMLVLDEVDCMLQKGFHEQVMQIYRALSQPQVLMYSATISREVEKLARSSGSSGGGVDELLPCLQFSDGISEEQIEDIGYASEDGETDGSNDYDSHCGSSGYEEDNDDIHSDGEIDSVEDHEETDNDLENRVEAFISKVIQGWKEELLTEKMSGIDL
uniref:DEAD-box ATP-dependent RNA helicase 41 n=1 Tax=Daucus carota subsp. sativus TaxID=79200 RepID=A0A166FCE6_DAUCS